MFSVPASEQYSQAEDSKASRLWAADSYQILGRRRHSARRFCSFFIFPANFAFSNITRERMVKGRKQQATLTRQRTVKRARRRQTQRRSRASLDQTRIQSSLGCRAASESGPTRLALIRQMPDALLVVNQKV